MKRAVAVFAALLLFTLPGCGSAEPRQSPAAAGESGPAAELEPAEVLASGCFLYSYSYEDGAVTVTVAAKDGMSAIMELWEGGGYRAVLRDGAGFFADLSTGELRELTAEELGAIIPDYSSISLVSSQEAEGLRTLEYSCVMDGEAATLLLQTTKGVLTAIDSPESPSTGVCPLLDFSADPPEDIFNK